MTTQTSSKQVFVSHSGRDRELARHIAKRLDAMGLTPLGLDAVEAGSAQRESLREQIRSSDAAVFLLTPSALKSEWTMVELGMAEGLDKEVLPVVAGVKQEELPVQFQTYAAVPFDRLDDAIEQLARRLITNGSESISEE